MHEAATTIPAEQSSTGRTAPGTAQGGPGAPQPVPLTRREVDVLTYGIEGLTARQTALRLGISHRTVEVFRATAREKLGAKTFTHAVVLYDRLYRNTEAPHG